MSTSRSKAELYGKPITVTFNIPKDGIAGQELKRYLEMGYRMAETRVAGNRVIIVLAQNEIEDYPGSTFRRRATNCAIDRYNGHEIMCGDRTYRAALLFPVPKKHSSDVAKRVAVANFEPFYKPGKQHMHIIRGAGRLTPTDITDLSTINGGTRTFATDVENLVSELTEELGLQLNCYMDPMPLNERTLQTVLH